VSRAVDVESLGSCSSPCTVVGMVNDDVVHPMVRVLLVVGTGCCLLGEVCASELRMTAGRGLLVGLSGRIQVGGKASIPRHFRGLIRRGVGCGHGIVSGRTGMGGSR
jgi:hypothetical protein